MFENKKILILGFARSGSETAKILINRNNKVILNDAKEEEKHDSLKIKELRDLGVEFVFGSHPDDLLDDSFDYLIAVCHSPTCFYIIPVNVIAGRRSITLYPNGVPETSVRNPRYENMIDFEQYKDNWSLLQ